MGLYEIKELNKEINDRKREEQRLDKQLKAAEDRTKLINENNTNNTNKLIEFAENRVKKENDNMKKFQIAFFIFQMIIQVVIQILFMYFQE